MVDRDAVSAPEFFGRVIGFLLSLLFVPAVLGFMAAIGGCVYRVVTRYLP